MNKLLFAVMAFLMGQNIASAWGGPGRVCFYENANYAGQSFCMDAGQQNYNLAGFFNDRISSISIDGDIQVTVYADANFSGQSLVVNGNMANLNDTGFWNDRISSIDTYGGGWGGGRPGPGPGRPGPGRPPGPVRPTPDAQVCFYEDANFSGQSFCMSEGQTINNLNGPWNDRISSMRIYGNLEVSLYADSEYRSPMGTFTRDEYNFANGIGNDAVSSIVVRRGRW